VRCHFGDTNYVHDTLQSKGSKATPRGVCVFVAVVREMVKKKVFTWLLLFFLPMEQQRFIINQLTEILHGFPIFSGDKFIPNNKAKDLLLVRFLLPLFLDGITDNATAKLENDSLAPLSTFLDRAIFF
jgi:hypothetical protein